MLLLSDFKLQTTPTAVLVKYVKEHFTCCWKHGLISQLIKVNEYVNVNIFLVKVVSKEIGHSTIVWIVQTTCPVLLICPDIMYWPVVVYQK